MDLSVDICTYICVTVLNYFSDVDLNSFMFCRTYLFSSISCLYQ